VNSWGANSVSHFQRLFFAYALLGVVLIGCILAAQVWRRRAMPAARSFLCVIVAGALWAFADAMGIFYPWTFWLAMAYFGIGALPIAWLAFCLEYSGRGKWLNKAIVVALLVIPAVTILAVATNDLHGWMWRNMADNGRIQVTYGPYHIISSIYSYLLFLMGFFLLLINLVESSPVHRRQGVIVILAGLIPWIANLLQILDVYPRSAPNPTPLAFIVSSLIFFWGLFHLHLLEIMPVAQRVVIEQMGDGLVLLEAQDRIIRVNPAAEALLRIKKSEANGRPLSEVLENWPSLVEGVTSHESAQLEIAHKSAEGTEYFEVKSASIKDDKGRKLGWFFFIREITGKKTEALERERILGELREALAKVKTLSGLLPICARCKKIRDDHGEWNQMEMYIQKHSEASFSHGLCPDCINILYSQIDKTL
jgi:PAS domain S-box-containing protein